MIGNFDIGHGLLLFAYGLLIACIGFGVLLTVHHYFKGDKK